MLISFLPLLWWKSSNRVDLEYNPRLIGTEMWNSDNQVYTVLREPVLVLKGGLKLSFERGLKLSFERGLKLSFERGLGTKF